MEIKDGSSFLLPVIIIKLLFEKGTIHNTPTKKKKQNLGIPSHQKKKKKQKK